MNDLVHTILAAISGLVKRRPAAGSKDRDPEAATAILCVLGEEQDRAVMAEICRSNQWRVFFAAGQEHGREILRRGSIQIVLLDRDLAENDWRRVMTTYAAESSRACVLLVSNVVEDYLWNEVVSHGGYDVLSKPLRQVEAARTVRLARSYWMTARATT